MNGGTAGWITAVITALAGTITVVTAWLLARAKEKNRILIEAKTLEHAAAAEREVKASEVWKELVASLRERIAKLEDSFKDLQDLVDELRKQIEQNEKEKIMELQRRVAATEVATAVQGEVLMRQVEQSPPVIVDATSHSADDISQEIAKANAKTIKDAEKSQ